MSESSVVCGKCLERDLEWRISKAGNRYLAARAEIRGESGRTIKVIYPAHQCSTDIELIESRKQEAQKRIDSGEIVKGQRIVVVKGRKIKIGTEGIVFWVANEPDGYGIIKVGFIDDEGVKQYISKANIQAAINEEAK